MSKLLLSPEWRELDAKAEIRAEVYKAWDILDWHFRGRNLEIEKERAVIAELVEFLTMNGNRKT